MTGLITELVLCWHSPTCILFSECHPKWVNLLWKRNSVLSILHNMESFPPQNPAGCGGSVPITSVPPDCSTRRVSGPRILLHWTCVNHTAPSERSFIWITVVVLQQEAEDWIVLRAMKLLAQALMESLWEAQAAAGRLLLVTKKPHGTKLSVRHSPHTHSRMFLLFSLIYRVLSQHIWALIQNQN